MSTQNVCPTRSVPKLDVSNRLEVGARFLQLSADIEKLVTQSFKLTEPLLDHFP